MRTCFFRGVIFALFIVLPISLFGQQVETSKKEAVNLQEIQRTLVFRSRISVTTEELNEVLISQIQKRKVNFILTAEDEESLKKVGGSELLIRTIRENLLKKLEEQIILYKKYTGNYNGKVEQKKIALEAAKEFVEKYKDDEYVKEIIEYLKLVIPDLERVIKAQYEVCQ